MPNSVTNQTEITSVNSCIRAIKTMLARLGRSAPSENDLRPFRFALAAVEDVLELLQIGIDSSPRVQLVWGLELAESCGEATSILYELAVLVQPNALRKRNSAPNRPMSKLSSLGQKLVQSLERLAQLLAQRDATQAFSIDENCLSKQLGRVESWKLN